MLRKSASASRDFSHFHVNHNLPLTISSAESELILAKGAKNGCSGLNFLFTHFVFDG